MGKDTIGGIGDLGVSGVGVMARFESLFRIPGRDGVGGGGGVPGMSLPVRLLEYEVFRL